MEENFSAFLEKDFDVKGWVNASFQGKRLKGKTDAYAASLVMKLQLFIKEVIGELKETGDKAVANLPRVMRNLQKLKQEGRMLQEQMLFVKDDIHKVEHDTAQSMETLMTMDNLKARMQSAMVALDEADSWSALSEDVESDFSSGNYKQVAIKLIRMQSSLQWLVAVPGYKEKHDQLEELKERFEQMVQKGIQLAITERSSSQAIEYATYFRQLDHHDVVEKYFRKEKTVELLRKWHGTTCSTDVDQDEQRVAKQLSQLYDDIYCTFHELQWCRNVFEEPVLVMVVVFSAVLKELHSDLERLMSEVLDGNPDVLYLLQDARKKTNDFVFKMQQQIVAENSALLDDDAVWDFSEQIYLPYQPFVKRYGVLEEALLCQFLKDKIIVEKEDFGEHIANMVKSLFEQARAANERCTSITSGCAYNGLINALQVYFSRYTLEFEKYLKSSHYQTIQVKDWSYFIHSLHLVRACGDILSETDKLEKEIMTSITLSVGKFPSMEHVVSPRHKLAVKNPFHHLDAMLLEDETDKDRLHALLERVCSIDSKSCVLDTVRQQFQELSEKTHKFAFRVVFRGINILLEGVPHMETWVPSSTSGVQVDDLPSFGFVPQAYITQIGEYLMTLPQHLEYLSEQDPTVLSAALSHGMLPYTDNELVSELQQVSDVWLVSMCRASMHVFAKNILKIPAITSGAAKQLLCDIQYLINVVDDLGVTAVESLSAIAAALHTGDEDAAGVPENILQVITSMKDNALQQQTT